MINFQAVGDYHQIICTFYYQNDNNCW